MRDGPNGLDIRALSETLELNARGKRLLGFNDQDALISKFSKHPRWEFHPNGDEFLQVIEGELELVLLHEAGPEELLLRADSICVVPKGVWHSPIPRGPVTLLSVGTYEGTRISEEDDPRS